MPEVPPLRRTSSLTDDTAAVFAPGGPVARVVGEYEPRASQQQMAALVAETFAREEMLLAEAGTGTGKTLAYLVPAILSGIRVLVSTGTKNLQEQIFFKDVPLLRDALGIPFTATCMKGRANYLCLQRYEQYRDAVSFDVPVRRGTRPLAWDGSDPRLIARGEEAPALPDAPRTRPRKGARRAPAAGPEGLGHAGRLPDAADRVLLPILDAWLKTTGTGDRAELADLPEDLPLWNELSATAETCLGSECPHVDDCFITRMRQRAAESDVVIVNHHLLCADASVRRGAYGEVIPAAQHLVLDEAHQLEDVATQYFGVAVSNYRVEELVRDGERLLAAAGLRHEADDIRAVLLGAGDRGRAFFEAVAVTIEGGPAAAGPVRSETRVRFTGETLQDLYGDATALVEALDGIDAAVRLLKVEPDPGGSAPPWADDLAAIARRAGELRDDLRMLVRADDPEYVYYVETRGRGVFLRAAPIDVSSVVGDLLLGRMKSVVLTSATLTVDGSFEYVRRRLGIRDARELRVTSEFDFREQAILYLPRRMPPPKAVDFVAAAGREVVEILKRTEGRAFVLFTSYAVLRDVQQIAAMALDYPMFVQGTAPRSVLLQQFRTTPHAVLFATSSFWQGVDVVGEALSCVIIDKLPFASPGDPITAARIEAVTRSGGDAFADYQVPLAILALQQGLGRLIRHRQDRGVLAILDPRLRTMGYGRRFLQSLPPAPVTLDPEDISRFFAR